MAAPVLLTSQLPKYKLPNGHEVGPLKPLTTAPQSEITVDDITKKFGPVVKFDPSIPYVVMAAVKQRLKRLVQIAAVGAMVRSRT